MPHIASQSQRKDIIPNLTTNLALFEPYWLGSKHPVIMKLTLSQLLDGKAERGEKTSVCAINDH